MAILHHGLFGKATGKIGNTVTYSLGKKTVVRMIGKTESPPTEKQLASRRAMAVVSAFLNPVNTFIKAGFALAAKESDMYAQNKAVSYNYKNALEGEYPDFSIDYTKVLLSLGDMARLERPGVELSGSRLIFTWEMNDSIFWTRRIDQVMVLVYFPELDVEGTDLQKAYFLMSGARRSELREVLDFPAELAGQRMEVYITVVSDDRTQIASSTYLGRFN